MNQKYIFTKSKDENNLILSESSEVDTGMFTNMCEETYDIDEINAAMVKSENSLISLLRTDNLFPPHFLMKEFIETLKLMVGSEAPETFEINFNDVDMLADKSEIVEKIPDDDKEDDISDLLDDDIKSIDETDDLLDSIADQDIDIDDD